jgi:hypothetical protein
MQACRCLSTFRNNTILPFSELKSDLPLYNIRINQYILLQARSDRSVNTNDHHMPGVLHGASQPPVQSPVPRTHTPRATCLQTGEEPFLPNTYILAIIIFTFNVVINCRVEKHSTVCAITCTGISNVVHETDL